MSHPSTKEITKESFGQDHHIHMVQTNKQSAGNILNMHNPDNLQSGPSSAQPPLHSSVTKAEEDTDDPFA